MKAAGGKENEGGRGAKRGRRRRWTVIGWVLLGCGVALFLTLAIVVHRASGILRQRVINTLSTRLQGRVQLPYFEVSILHGIQVDGRGLKIWTDAHPQPRPLVAVKEFHFQTMWWKLLRSPMHVGQVRLSGLTIDVPPAEQSAQSGEPQGEEAKKRKIEIVVDNLTVDDARLVMETDKPGKDPTVFRVHSLTMQRVGRQQPMRFHAFLVNPKPVGEIETTGTFGPFDAQDVGRSPVAGTYRFSHADLNSIKGLGGMLSSTGTYEGRLARLAVDGTTDTPNFSLDVSGHALPLRTRFHAIVDGTNGDTYLQPVDAWLNKSHIVARGSVERVKDKGHAIRLEVQVGPQADIGDMLTLAMKTRPPLMHGRLTLKTSLTIPPGRRRVAEKLELKGRFAMEDATFPDARFQKAVDELSLRGQGRPDAANGSLKHVKIASRVQGRFEMGAGRLRVPEVDYRVPGAEIRMHGVYTMDGKHFDFEGHARLKAKVSQMVSSWWKRLLLIPVDPVFARKGAGTDLPIAVTGDKHGTHVGLKIAGLTIGD